MHQGLKWFLALVIVLSGFVLMLIPEYGMTPYWGQRWGERVPPYWHGGFDWPGGGFEGDMMRGSIGVWNTPGRDLGDAAGIMGAGLWQAALSPQQRVGVAQIQAQALREEGPLQAQLYAARAHLLTLSAAAQADPSALAKARDDLVEVMGRIAQVRELAAQRIQAVMSMPPTPPAAGHTPTTPPATSP